MRRIALLALAGFLSTHALADEQAASELTAAQIVDKNVAARGGLDAWRKIQTMVWVGHIARANSSAMRVPFSLEMKRPDKTRFEIRVRDQISTRIFDGEQGWKVLPGQKGQPEVQPYSLTDLKYARDGGGLDGPLIDHQAKGIAVALDGIDQVDGNKAYRLSLTLPSGGSQHVWIDAKSFLEVKQDREVRNQYGPVGTLYVYYKDYRAIDGLQIPMTLETRGEDAAKGADKMVIDKVLLNPSLDERLFAKPNVMIDHRGVTVDTRRPPQVPAPRRAAGGRGAPSEGMTGFSPKSLAGVGGMK